jgi:predicted ester cyclase
MSPQQHATLVRRMYAALDANDLSAVPELFDPAWRNYDPAMPPLAGHDGARQLITILKSAFPDLRTTVDQVLVEGDLVAARLTHAATHLGPFLGIPPTGRQATVTATGIFRVQDGRLAENRVVFDALGLLRQLGIVPEPAMT